VLLSQVGEKHNLILRTYVCNWRNARASQVAGSSSTPSKIFLILLGRVKIYKKKFPLHLNIQTAVLDWDVMIQQFVIEAAFL
jgi:hypothetical protein